MAEFEVGGHTYRTDRKLDVFKQASVVRRIAPLFAGLAGSLGGRGGEGEQGDGAEIGAALLASIGPVTEALAQMKDEDSDFIMKSCLQVVSRRMAGGTGWSKMLTPSGDLMFEDVELGGVVQIVWKVLEESLGGFFLGLGINSSVGASA